MTIPLKTFLIVSGIIIVAFVVCVRKLFKMKAEYSLMATENQQRLKQVDGLSNDLKQYVGQNLKLTDASRKSEQQISRLSSLLNNRDQKIAELSSALENRKKQITTLYSYLTHSNEQIRALSYELRKREDQISELVDIAKQQEDKLRAGQEDEPTDLIVFVSSTNTFHVHQHGGHIFESIPLSKARARGCIPCKVCVPANIRIDFYQTPKRS